MRCNPLMRATPQRGPAAYAKKFLKIAKNQTWVDEMEMQPKKATSASWNRSPEDPAFVQVVLVHGNNHERHEHHEELRNELLSKIKGHDSGCVIQTFKREHDTITTVTLSLKQLGVGAENAHVCVPLKKGISLPKLDAYHAKPLEINMFQAPMEDFLQTFNLDHSGPTSSVSSLIKRTTAAWFNNKRGDGDKMRWNDRIRRVCNLQ
eukprot:sb/3470438/